MKASGSTSLVPSGLTTSTSYSPGPSACGLRPLMRVASMTSAPVRVSPPMWTSAPVTKPSPSMRRSTASPSFVVLGEIA